MFKRTRVVAVKFSPEDVKLLKKVCDARRESMSGFVRRSVQKELANLAYLSPSEKKALGVKRRK